MARKRTGNERPSTRGMTNAGKLMHYGWTVTETGCWEWNGSRFSQGYGRFVVGAQARKAHRIAYEAWVGPIGDDLIVRHTCDNPPCINPDHLILGTAQDNMNDMVARGRNIDHSGEKHPNARLTESNVKTIRVFYENGWTQQEIADMFGISFQHVSDIVNRKKWKHI